MGLMDLVGGIFKKGGRSGFSGQKEKCPKCKTDITLDMERCPKCGTRIESMFRIECPKCKSQNEMNAEICVKCGHSFVSESQPGKTQYRCPICGYVADYYMLSCPSCGTKFVS